MIQLGLGWIQPGSQMIRTVDPAGIEMDAAGNDPAGIGDVGMDPAKIGNVRNDPVEIGMDPAGIKMDRAGNALAGIVNDPTGIGMDPSRIGNVGNPTEMDPAGIGMDRLATVTLLGTQFLATVTLLGTLRHLPPCPSPWQVRASPALSPARPRR
ncbi:hypothetical protein DUI87_33762 [Hirundo rustica rustica]|uniref:Uncharacterized protein n=1 Tax=Hirundo rustica rustica TaxID=333673 RepID=A0A3M0ILA7_HIRRU|nr:hypothetical protein DUI87_33762 [Hirundo rustica rustica]